MYIRKELETSTPWRAGLRRDKEGERRHEVGEGEEGREIKTYPTRAQTRHGARSRERSRRRCHRGPQTFDLYHIIHSTSTLYICYSSSFVCFVLFLLLCMIPPRLAILEYNKILTMRRGKREATAILK